MADPAVLSHVGACVQRGGESTKLASHTRPDWKLHLAISLFPQKHRGEEECGSDPSWVSHVGPVNLHKQ